MHLVPTQSGRRRTLRFSALLIIYGPALFVLGVTVLAKLQARVPISFFSLDATSTLNGHPLTGAQSTLGVLVWCAAAGICFFSCVVLHARRGDKDVRSFLLWSGVIATVLALDDMFLVHEDLARRYLLLSEEVVFLAYGAVLDWYLIRFRRNILGSEYPLLLLAFVLLGSSMVVDFLQASWPGSGRIFFEGGTKLLGIVTWSAYLIRICFQTVITPAEMQPEQTLMQRAKVGRSVTITTTRTGDQTLGLSIPPV